MTRGCRLAVEKECLFTTSSVEYLGHRIDQDSLHSSDEKVWAIKGA